MCGVQGSGKSHTVSVILENMLLPSSPNIGTVVKPLSGLVLHFSEGGPYSQPCEAAWVGKPVAGSGVETPPVRVFVSKSSLKTMQEVYAPLGDAVTVEPLLFSQEELDAQAFLSMMAVGQSDNVPLYMQTVLVRASPDIEGSRGSSNRRAVHSSRSRREVYVSGLQR